MMQKICQCTLLKFTFLLVLFGCTENVQSYLDIDNGHNLNPSKKYKGRSVVAINKGSCTATIVSQNTVVTAAHCLNRQGSNLCVDSGDYEQSKLGRRLCTSNTLIHPKYRSAMGYDLAVAVFSDMPFKDFSPVRLNTDPANNVSVQAGEDILLVGYSPFSHDDRSNGTKHWGLNNVRRTLNSRGERDTIQLVEGNDPSGVGISGGDSGGPMFDSECRLIGVASRSSSREEAVPGSVGFHTNLTHSGNSEWLVSLVKENGAQFCGVAGTDESYCQSQYLSKKILPFDEALREETYPCVSDFERGGSADTDAGGNPQNPPLGNDNGQTPPNAGQGQPGGNQAPPPNQISGRDLVAMAAFPSDVPGYAHVGISLKRGQQIAELCIVTPNNQCAKTLIPSQASISSPEREVFVVNEPLMIRDLNFGVKVVTKSGVNVRVQFKDSAQ